MDTPFKALNGSRCTRKKRKRKNKGFRNRSKSPLSKLGVLRRTRRTIKRKSFKLTDECLKTIIQGFHEHPILTREGSRRNLINDEQRERNPVDQTIDLCDGDDVVNSSSSDAGPVLSSEDKHDPAVVIDLSDDISNQKEVIDLTESGNALDVPGRPNVADVNKEMSEEEPSPKTDNDDIFVIGTFSRVCQIGRLDKKKPVIPLSNKWTNLRSWVTYNQKLRKECLKKPSVLDKSNQNKNQLWRKSNRPRKNPVTVGENVYVNSPVAQPSSGLRPIIIDGNNVAFVHSNCNFSCKRLEICIRYFKEKGHKVTAFVPQFRLNTNKSDDPALLRRLEKRGDVVLTPSKKIDGRNIVPYDDRFIVQTAVLKGGIIVTRDNYNDLLKENPGWAETIKYRTLAFTWVDDVLMFPKDPLGEFGPTLEQFLRFH